jgi:hypothetical protein
MEIDPITKYLLEKDKKINESLLLTAGILSTAAVVAWISKHIKNYMQQRKAIKEYCSKKFKGKKVPYSICQSEAFITAYKNIISSLTKGEISVCVKSENPKQCRDLTNREIVKYKQMLADEQKNLKELKTSYSKITS